MKKTLIALAALAATGAFAQVTIKGTFDPSVASQKITYGDGTSQTQNKILNNVQGTSQITFYGVEDLGGGMKASFLLENDFDTRYDGRGPNATGAASNSSSGSVASNIGSQGGEQYLALEGGFGKIALGAPNTASLTTQSSAQPFGTKIGGGFGAVNTGHVRQNNTVSYTTPMMSGFSAQVSYSFGTKADATGGIANEVGANTDIGVFYANGPLAAGVSFWNTASTSTAAGAALAGANNEVNAFATYDFKVVKVGAGYFTEKTDGLAGAAASPDSSAYTLSINAPLSAKLNLLASASKKDDKTVANLDRTINAIGLKYTMSARTSIYARYVSDKTDNVTTAASAAETITTAIGIMHNF